jgi:hypothetical protein
MKPFKKFIEDKELIEKINPDTKFSGNTIAKIYEGCVYIVARLSGSNIKPKVEDVKKIIKEDEFDKSDDKAYSFFTETLNGKSQEAKNELLDFISSIGGPVKQIKGGGGWGSSVSIIWDSINDFYYKVMPDEYAGLKTKDNTADIVFIWGTTEQDFADSLLSIKEEPLLGSISFDKNGLCELEFDGKKICNFVQVSLKKGEGDARIGRVTTLLRTRGELGQPTKSESYDLHNFDFGDNIELSEGLLSFIKDKIGDISDYVKMGVSKIKGFLFKKFKKWSDFLSKSLKSFLKSDKLVKSMKSLNQLADNIDLNEAKEKGTKITPAFREEMGKFSSLLTKTGIQSELNNITSNVSSINSRFDKEFISVKGDGINLKIPIVALNKKVKKWLKDYKAGTLLKKPSPARKAYKEFSSPLFLTIGNYSAYATINIMLNNILKDSKDIKSLTKALVTQNALLDAEAKFGTTNLPLWIVYGGEKGTVKLLGTKGDYRKKREDALAKAAEKSEFPFIVIEINVSRSSTKGFEYTAVYVYFLFEIDGKSQPKYIRTEYRPDQADVISFKVEANSVQVGVP